MCLLWALLARKHLLYKTSKGFVFVLIHQDSSKSADMTQSIRYLAADLANTNLASLEFPHDEKSQRASRAAHNKIDPNADKISRETLVQIVTLENISHSKTSRLDDLLAADDMDAVGADRLRARQPRIIRNVDLDDQNDGNNQGIAPPNTNDHNYFKLTLQDCFGTLIYGIEVEKLLCLSGKNNKNGFPVNLGSKMLLNNADIVSGVILLNPSNTEFLNGMVPQWVKDADKKHIAFLKGELEKLRPPPNANAAG